MLTGQCTAMQQAAKQHRGSSDAEALRQHTLMAECKERAISLSCSSLGLLPRISGNQNWPTAPFM